MSSITSKYNSVTQPDSRLVIAMCQEPVGQSAGGPPEESVSGSVISSFLVETQDDVTLVHVAFTRILDTVNSSAQGQEFDLQAIFHSL